MKIHTLLLAGMKFTAVALLISGCTVEEDEPKNVIWNCTCDFTLDGTPGTYEAGEGCGDQDDAQRVADEATAQCQAELDAVCTTTCDPCSCQCDPDNDKACEPE